MVFLVRSHEKELLDGTGIPFEHIKRNMQELAFINRYLGGHRITQRGMKFLAGGAEEELHVAEIGCGGGDNLQAIQSWARKESIRLRLTGIDINPECISFARQQVANRGMAFICSDYKKVQFPSSPDIIFSSLFCHHFDEGELVFMLQWMHQNCKLGFFINDLHRHPLAYYSIRLLTRLFSKSYLVKNDAPLSVKRGFTRREWTALFSQTGIDRYQCRWHWAFRWLVCCTKKENKQKAKVR